MTKRIAAAAVFLLAAAFLLAAPAALPPPPTRWVTDNAGFLSEGKRRSLDAQLEAYQRGTGHHVLVWVGSTTGDTPVEDFTVRTFQAWKVGRKGFDDGLVLFIFADDRKVRFEVGYGLEDEVPDAIASRIIREAMAPRLQAGDRDGAVQDGVDAALTAIGGAPAARPGRRGQRGQRGRPIGTLQKIIIGIAALGFLVLLITNPRLAFFLLASTMSGGRGGGYSGGGGGGGWSGGGGRSGGGGATGSW